jgi:hypothetical protein
MFMASPPARPCSIFGGKTGLFHRALAQDGYIVVSFDNRGTPAHKGRE